MDSRNGRTAAKVNVWPTIIGTLVGALVTGLVSMSVFGRQLERVETKVEAVAKQLDSVEARLEEHRRFHSEK